MNQTSFMTFIQESLVLNDLKSYHSVESMRYIYWYFHIVKDLYKASDTVMTFFIVCIITLFEYDGER